MNAPLPSPFAALARPSGCPACGIDLTGTPRCPGCDLRLHGPDAEQLWKLDTELAFHTARRDALLAARPALLTGLASDHPPGDPYSSTDEDENAPAGAQNTLLVMGGGLLACAAVVFAAVTYTRLGLGGRVAVLLVLTLAAALAAPLATSRRLRSTAETAAGLTVALTVVAAFAARHAQLGPDVTFLTWYSGCAAVAAVLGLVHGQLASVRLTTTAGVVAAHVPLVLLLSRGPAMPGTWAFVFALAAAANLLAWHLTAGRAGRFPVRVRDCTAFAGVACALASTFAAVACAGTDGQRVLCAAAFAVLGAVGFAAGQAGAHRSGFRAAALAAAAFAADVALVGTDVQSASAWHALMLSVAVAGLAGWCWFRPGTTRSARAAGSLLLIPAGAFAAAGAVQGPALVAVAALLVLAAAGLLFAASDNRRWAAGAYAFGTATKAVAAAAALPLDGDARPAAMALAAAVCATAAQFLKPRLSVRRGAFAGAAAGALTAWWVLLGLHRVELVEAYTVPAACVLLAVGWIARRALPTLHSGETYWAGLMALLAPSAVLCLHPGDEQVVRALLLVAGATAVLFAGIALRLSAPLVAGALALTVAALRLIAPYVDTVPRWLSLGLAGALLLGLGATYEARRRDLEAVRARLSALG